MQSNAGDDKGIDSLVLWDGIGNISRDCIPPYSKGYVRSMLRLGQDEDRTVSDFVMLDLLLAVSLPNFIDSYNM